VVIEQFSCPLQTVGVDDKKQVYTAVKNSKNQEKGKKIRTGVSGALEGSPGNRQVFPRSA
jgi:hypothetical protein